MIESCRPDIVMPAMDGEELTKAVRTMIYELTDLFNASDFAEYKIGPTSCLGRQRRMLPASSPHIWPRGRCPSGHVHEEGTRTADCRAGSFDVSSMAGARRIPHKPGGLFAPLLTLCLSVI